MITKYGAGVVRISLLLAAALFALVFFSVPAGAVRILLLAVVAAGAILVLNFFRDPERSVPTTGGVVVSPADGKIVAIDELFEEEYLRGDAVQVSIFMSPLNVHVNRFPVSGTVGYFRHIPGEHLVAFDEKSSTRNERTLIGVEDDGYKVLFAQIAGTVARRIVADIAVGQRAVRGERFGMIKFGSRVDVKMPRGTELAVRLNDRVVAGETILARYPGAAGTSLPPRA